MDPLNTRISDVPKLRPDLHILPSVVTKHLVTKGFLNLGIAIKTLSSHFDPREARIPVLCVYSAAILQS